MSINKPAFPAPNNIGVHGVSYRNGLQGLTKLEYAAIHFAAGMGSASEFTNDLAIKYAKDLLEKLEKEQA